MGTQIDALRGPVKPVAIRVKTERCLRTHNRFSLCQTCTETCQAGAIQVSSTVAMDRQMCTGCGACLATCPAGVFEGDDAVGTLLEAAAQMRGRGIVALACPHHSEPRRAPAYVDGVICADRCLAALGPATYLRLLGLGIGKIVARLDACAACPKGKARANIESSLTTVTQLLAPLQQDGRVSAVNVAESDWQVRPLAGVRDARVSRRDFLRVVTGRPTEANAPLSHAQTEDIEHPRLKNAPRERRSLLSALERLVDDSAITSGQAATTSFGQLAASDACTACHVCANVCPTDALRLSIRHDDTYTLSFLSAACTRCQECIDMCDYDALHWADPLPLSTALEMQPAVLRSGVLHGCDRCGVRFARVAETNLCPLCSLRAAHRFGVRMPPGLQRRLARQTRR